MDIAVRIMQKAIKSNTDLYIRLLEYWDILIEAIASLSQLLMSRSLRSLLPCTRQQLQSKTVQKTKFCTPRTQCQEALTQSYDKDSKELTKSRQPAHLAQVIKERCKMDKRCSHVLHCPKILSYSG